ncbi:hypothetical protein CEUSTIGMA_g2398.t1 [Chlamydomonas eustigma]|uniref:Uncharacterized protein n=1 Tax=Chlamydomonas eustigma TaxID=1157962 RepID=A0A250WWF1_9CHLO|nr:hypothetical protein CEUSTIGMA_g2398.t1 [Chlamydomonas eustigma]|eukprot:GAX74952.1 hypothetical protein CEUSTIGMA_g2398.t1 [Chlamydomonas eustigma]
MNFSVNGIRSLGKTTLKRGNASHEHSSICQDSSSICVKSNRRDILISASFPAVTLWEDLLSENQPERGNCPTCIGAVDGTLGSCSQITSCLSSYDDDPSHFIPPWEYQERSVEDAMKKLKQAVLQTGAVHMEQEGGRYLYAVFPPDELGLSSLPLPGSLGQLGQAPDDVEFLFADDNDTRVEIRSASRLYRLPDGNRQHKRLEAIRAFLRWEQVPVMRNRKRVFGIIESPWDTYGPTAPSGKQWGGMRLLEEELGED